MASPTTIGFEHKIVVGISQMVVSNNPNAILTTYSLGSCLGVCLYDPLARVGGMIHFMLPDSAIDPQKALDRPAMFLDTGLPALLRAAYQLRAEKHRLRLYAVGGAQILDSGGFFNIGKRNYEALLQLLAQQGLRLQGEHTGGLNCGRLGPGAKNPHREPGQQSGDRGGGYRSRSLHCPGQNPGAQPRCDDPGH